MSEAVETKQKESIGEFIQHTREEMTRVSFPTKDEVQKTTLIVIINVIFFAIFLFVVDQAWSYLLEGLTWIVNKIAGA